MEDNSGGLRIVHNHCVIHADVVGENLKVGPGVVIGKNNGGRPTIGNNVTIGKTVWEATKVVAVFSFLIEFTQLLFHLGTFQISDLTYNILGGAVGGVIYYLGYCRKRKNRIRNRGQLSEH